MNDLTRLNCHGVLYGVINRRLVRKSYYKLYFLEAAVRKPCFMLDGLVEF